MKVKLTAGPGAYERQATNNQETIDTTAPQPDQANGDPTPDIIYREPNPEYGKKLVDDKGNPVMENVGFSEDYVCINVDGVCSLYERRHTSAQYVYDGKSQKVIIVSSGQVQLVLDYTSDDINIVSSSPEKLVDILNQDYLSQP